MRPQPEWAFWPAGRADRELTAPCALTAAPFSAELRRHQLPGGCCPPGGASQPPDRGGGQGGGGRGHGALRAALLLAPGLRGPRAPRRPAPPRPPRPPAQHACDATRPQVEIDKPIGLRFKQSSAAGGGLEVTGVSGNAAKSGIKVGDTVIYTSR